MPKATCRCGQTLSYPANGPDRVVCPKCGSKIRVRVPAAGVNGSGSGDGDGYLRFSCLCGRRLKVRADAPSPSAGKCPDCGRVVPVPADLAPSPPPTGLETPTEEMSDEDHALIERWAARHAKAAPAPTTASAPAVPVPKAAVAVTVADDDAAPSRYSHPQKVEAGLRVCPRCGRPVHLSADACRQCGAHVPKR